MDTKQFAEAADAFEDLCHKAEQNSGRVFISRYFEYDKILGMALAKLLSIGKKRLRGLEKTTLKAPIISNNILLRAEEIYKRLYDKRGLTPDDCDDCMRICIATRNYINDYEK